MEEIFEFLFEVFLPHIWPFMKKMWSKTVTCVYELYDSLEFQHIVSLIMLTIGLIFLIKSRQEKKNNLPEKHLKKAKTSNKWPNVPSIETVLANMQKITKKPKQMPLKEHSIVAEVPDKFEKTSFTLVQTSEDLENLKNLI